MIQLPNISARPPVDIPFVSTHLSHQLTFLSAHHEDMAGSVFCVICLLPFIVAGVTGNCDPNYCCCTEGPISVTRLTMNGNPMVRFQYSAIPGSRGCSSQGSQMVNCILGDNNVCSGSDYQATKSGDSVTFTVQDYRCDFQFRCQSGSSCTATENWPGTYSVTPSASGSKTVTFSAVFLLVVTLVGRSV